MSGRFPRYLADLKVMGIDTFPSRHKPGFYDAVLKIPDVTEEEVRAELSKVEDQEGVDVGSIV